ncbi:SWI/SNF-related matrix-associated actin-dependent regulator of chromatin subfamily A-like protein 1 isoform X2 [Mangifera indica]|uniref:SWI/SNF-related matrix-associated actin-dependent regulator of chromatin subfamily A-like protein 1 isoform X2 n=1 Tax=Mangifera indica TaxID=29780 RepID=UPI001CF9F6D4|nr:SWI/SNF-related matrix-associated actin-dependent regulator of chromatin subfamily A-like protein 1 isoform X2 [Mangifera indica]
MEVDEWDLTAEEMDSLERDALQQIAQRNNSSSSLNCNNQNPQTTNRQQSHPSFSFAKNQPSITSTNTPISNSRSNKVEALPPGSRVLPTLVAPSVNSGESSKERRQKLSVKFLLHAAGNVAAKFPYEPVLVGAFRKIPKATWNAKERLWMFPISSLSSAETILSEIPGYKVEVENLDSLVQRAIAAASAIPDLREKYDQIPSHIESKLLPFQRDGVRFALQHGGRVLLADEMGLGKTLQAIAIATCVRDFWPALILAPSSLRLHWASMIQQWLDVPSSDIVVVLSQLGGSYRSGFTVVSSSTRSTIHLDGLFNIVSYDVVPKVQNVLIASDFKVVIADESHFLKNAQAKRTTAVIPIIKKAQYAILLSGTPALSRPIELFKQGIFGMYQGASNHEELHNLMKATVMIRRLKKDVLSELPVKRRQQVFLDLAEKDMKPINALFRELEVIKGKIKNCKSEEEIQSLKFSENNLINKIYTDSAEAKIPAVLDYLETIIEAGCKFLIFAHHQSMLDSIYNFLLKKKVHCIRIDGNTPATSRQALVTDFQDKDDIKAAVLSIRAGGVGLTLTAASTVIFAELSWTPGDLIQAEDRAHRIGQVSSVNIYYLLANDTVDDIIWDVVQNKLETLGQMLDGHENNVLEVSASQLKSRPAKQKTLDTFLKRCNSVDDSEHESKHKYQKH